jgi:hypothetical protein
MHATMKTWATPMAIGTFTISAFTGLLIFFDIEMGMIEPVHKWCSWLLVAGIVLHVLTNLKPFIGYFSNSRSLFVIGSAVVVTVLSLFPILGEHEEGEGHGGDGAARALELATLDAVAPVLRITPAELAARLEKSGIRVGATSLTIREIAARNGKEGRDVLGSVLGEPIGRPD